MGPVGTAECVAWLPVELFRDCGEVVFGDNHVGVEYYEIFAGGSFGAVVARLARSGVFLDIVMQVKPVFVSFDYIGAWFR